MLLSKTTVRFPFRLGCERMNSRGWLLDGTDHRLIQRLRLAAKRRITGQVAGEQRSPALGGGIEFADYRPYLPGDDVRQVDWMVFLRLRKLMVKLGAEERELTLVPILDTSLSMQFGDPDKFRAAKKICAILVGIALETGNRAAILGMGRNLDELIPSTRDARSLSWIAQSLDRVPATNLVDYRACMRRFAGRWGGRCLAVWVSDLLFEGWEEVVSTLAASGSEAHVVQIFAPCEADPGQQGELTFVDRETDAEVPLHLDAPMLAAYRAEFAAHGDSVARHCSRLGLGHARVSSAEPLNRIFHHDLRKAGIVW